MIKNCMTPKNNNMLTPDFAPQSPCLQVTADTPERIGQLIADPPSMDGLTTNVRGCGSIKRSATDPAPGDSGPTRDRPQRGDLSNDK